MLVSRLLMLPDFKEYKHAERLTDLSQPVSLVIVTECSECYRAVAHAAGRTQRRQRSRENAHDNLQNCFPSFLFHDAYCLLLLLNE